MTRDKLEQNQIWIYFLAVAVAVLAGVLIPSITQSWETLVTPLIAILMYAMFLQIPFLQLHHGLSNKRFLLALLVANFIFIPLLVFVLTRGLNDYPAIFIGALLVLLTPCIDYVVVFTHIGKGDSKSVLSATPILLLLQLLLLPVYLNLMLDERAGLSISVEPFLHAFLMLIAAPLLLALGTSYVARSSTLMSQWNSGWTWLPVPAMVAVLIVVIGSQITYVISALDQLMPVIPVYICFMALAPFVGALSSRLFNLQAETARAVVFSSSTRNSLVVLPLALALPEDIRDLAATAVITQTLIELFSELIYVRAVPKLVWRT